MRTLFIDNLPKGFSSHDLWKLFAGFGHIVDAYVPHIQRHRINGRFGFIEVQSWEQGERLIHEVHGLEVGSTQAKVNWAKYPKRLRRSMRQGFDDRGNKQLNCRYKEQQGKIRRNAESVQRVKSAKVIKLEKAMDNLEWLERSLTCCSEIPRDIDSLRLLINNAFQEKIVVRDLGKLSFFLRWIPRKPRRG